MNTNNQNTKTGLSNRPEQVEQERKDLNKAICANRGLRKEVVLNALKSQLPKYYDYAEIVGKWIWLEIPKDKIVTSILFRLGFHWNERRAVFQHPCGAFAPFGVHPGDPREYYESYFVVALKDLQP